MSKGWECPKCGAVHAPWVPKCGNCPGSFGSTGAATTNPTGLCLCPRDSSGSPMHNHDCPLGKWEVSS